MGYWQTKVLPKIKKVFEKKGAKKAAAAEACKTFDDSKEEYSKVFEEKKTELQTKVIEIYEASGAEIKSLVKEPKTAGLKKHSAGVEKFLDELSKAEFPGSKPAYEASTKFGATYVSGPIFFVFEKVSTYIVTEEKTREVEVPAAPESTEAAAETTTKPAEEEATSGAAEKEKELVVVEEEKMKEEVVAPPAVTAEVAPVAAPEPPKPEESAPTEPPKP